MAHSASMGPPLSPRETRRSVRRSAPSISASTSKSPDSDQPPREKQRTTSSSSRNKRLKQEDYDDVPEDQKVQPTPSTISTGSNNGVNGKPKRRGKEKEKDKDKQAMSSNNQDADSASIDLPPLEYNDEDDQGITRCICGSTEDDPDAGEFMVQCETCKVWQHGLCMGYLSEDQVHDDDYYCEECRPDLHTDLVRKTKRPARQTSATSRSDHPANSRVSRSHSPSHLSKQASKRRNTMNSRDAAFDESLKEIIEATAAEAAAVNEVHPTERTSHPPETDALKKKRKRSIEDLANKKRTRSASTSSDRQSAPPISTETPPLPPPPKPPTTKQKRAGGGGSRKTAAGSEPVTIEPDEVNKRQGNSSRPKATNAPKRPPLSHSISHGSAPVTQEHGLKRNQASGTHTSTAADARAYRNTHAYAVSQQTLFTSWNLPDYLSHLEHILPTDVPQPLEVRSSIAISGAAARADSTDRTMERGVKVKWPAKRMSVGDMNKRVRALVEWVGREQASALDRGRRRQALEVALREPQLEEPDSTSDGTTAMEVDQPPNQQSTPARTNSQLYPSLEMSTQTMKMMEELMEELIGFQEKFGPGAKSRDRRTNTNS
ncbi:hypothetical protein BJ165DRAFT_1453476 [Panaeolus papilionaceus]|nr:hypothetical protein BJ165DRAFT_1453476 [Panaeolus papilionaceus]